MIISGNILTETTVLVTGDGRSYVGFAIVEFSFYESFYCMIIDIVQFLAWESWLKLDGRRAGDSYDIGMERWESSSQQTN